MENESTQNVNVNAWRVALVMREFSFDLLRAMESAVPVALADVAGDLAPERRARIAQRVFAETRSRYAVNAAATLLTLRSDKRM